MSWTLDQNPSHLTVISRLYALESMVAHLAANFYSANELAAVAEHHHAQAAELANARESAVMLKTPLTDAVALTEAFQKAMADLFDLAAQTKRDHEAKGGIDVG